MLSGELRVGSEITMYAGDFQHLGQDSVHPVQSTGDGCLLYLVSSLHDQLLGDASAR